ncbi:MAG TPA: hypothetical protein PKC15_07795 [Rhodocyclaceae bacterium]|uniref:WYL domain-containing protein n=1 Tax=Plasticicumulans sp. TaxID=2307179 RepID=UPI002CFD9CFE|nr:hypothetical protein [Rhodocyclaceae bacterium]
MRSFAQFVALLATWATVWAWLVWQFRGWHPGWLRTLFKHVVGAALGGCAALVMLGVLIWLFPDPGSGRPDVLPGNNGPLFALAFLLVLLAGWMVRRVRRMPSSTSIPTQSEGQARVAAEVAALRAMANRPASTVAPVWPAASCEASAATLPKQELARSGKRARRGVLATVEFSYLSDKGEWTERRVDVTAVDGFYIHAFCHLRHEERTFRLDRIQGDVIDMNTGEVFPPRVWASRCMDI